MQTTIRLCCILLSMQLWIITGCKKTEETSWVQELEGKKKPPPPPPPAPQFYFSNCGFPTINGSFRKGEPTSSTITMNYVNSPGGSYPAFTSTTLNGITLTAPAGVLNVGSGSIVYTASGTPLTAGQMMMTVSIGTSLPCAFVITILNPILTGGNCGDPGSVAGSTGCVTFNYSGQTVTYSTVRARDGKIWLQQNLGSPQVAWDILDAASFGDYFQWGRWDDGHQRANSGTITGSAALQNPSHIASGYPHFITGEAVGVAWWSANALSTDTWSGTVVSSTNGKDPCAALGAGWRMPTSSDWNSVLSAEGISEGITGFHSNLKLTTGGI